MDTKKCQKSDVNAQNFEPKEQAFLNHSKSVVKLKTRNILVLSEKTCQPREKKL